VKLHSPQFEKSLCRAVKQAIRRSPDLKREFRRAGKHRGTRLPNWVGFLFFTFFALFLPWTAVGLTDLAASGLAVLNLLAAYAALLSASALWVRLEASKDLAPLFLLPIDDSAIFRWEIQQALKGQLLSLLLLLGGLAGIAFNLDFSLAKDLALIPIGLLAWLAQLAVVVLLAARMPRSFGGYLIIGGFLFLPFVIVTWGAFGPIFITLFKRCVPTLNIFLPASWPLSLLQLLLPNPQWAALALLLPMAILFCTVPSSLRLLRCGFGFKERPLLFGPDSFPDLIPAVAPGVLSVDGAIPNLPDSRGHLGETAIADIILSPQFLAPPAWSSSGPIERWFWRLLNSREKALAELVFSAGVRLSASWLSIFRMMLVVAAAGLLAGLASDTAKYWIVGIGFGIATIRVLVAFLGTGGAFTPVASRGVNIHM
jgi:hypothetical protein